MSGSRSPSQFEQANSPRLERTRGRSFVVLPSWLLSFLLHTGLVVILAATLSGRRGGIVGDPDGDFRKIGIYVGHSGDGGDGTGGETGTGTDSRQMSNSIPGTKSAEANAIDSQVAGRQPAPPPTTSAPPESQPPSPPVSDAQSKSPATASPAATKLPAIIGPGTSRAALPTAKSNRSTQTAGVPEANSAPGRPRSGRSAPGRGGPRGSWGTAPFFGIWDTGAKFVYVIDCSGSMFSYNAMQAAKDELLSSLRSLRRSQQFQIVFYNLDQKWLKVPGNTDCQYFAASETNRRLAGQFIAEVQPDGGTQHLPALELALRLEPDVIYFLTDAGEPAMKPQELDQVRQRNQGRSRIHCVQFGMSDESTAPAETNFLRKLAAENNGDYVYRNVKRFADSARRVSRSRVPSQPERHSGSAVLREQ